MPTRFYLSNSAAPVSPAFAASWEEKANADRGRMVTAKSGSQLAARSVPGPSVGNAGNDILVRQYVSDPIGAQTVDGTIKAVIPARLDSPNADVKAMLVAKVVSGDGLTLRGTLLAEAAVGYGSDWPRQPDVFTPEPPFQNRRFHSGSGTALTNVVAQAGDRIVVELGAVGDATDNAAVELLLGDPQVTSSPATVVDDSGVGTIAWTSLTRVGFLDDAAAEVDLLPAEVSHYLKATGFGFAVPGDAVIVGITVDVTRKRGIGTVKDHRVRLVKAGVIGATDRANLGTNWPTAFAAARYGSGADLWGDSWDPADINSSGFGVALAAAASGDAGDGSVDNIRVTVSYTAGGAFVAVTRDLADNETDQFEGAPWIEFSGTISGITVPELEDPPPPVIAVPGPVARPSVRWKTFLCDRLGVPLAALTTIAVDVSLKWERNRPVVASMTLPADDPLLGRLHTDGFPYLYRRARTLKMYREELVIELVNLVPNPSFEVNTTGWGIGGTGGGTLSRQSTFAKVGTWSLRVITAGSVTNEGTSMSNLTGLTGGATYTVSVWLYSAAGFRARVAVQDTTGGVNGAFTAQETTVPAAIWTRVTVTRTLDASADGIVLYVVTSSTAPAQAVTFYLDAVQVEQAAAATDYVDSFRSDLGWVLRFAGPVETRHLVGTPASKTVAIAALDPLHTLNRRFARNANGTADLVTFANTAATQILRLLVDRTNERGESGLTTEGGVFEASAARTVEWAWKKVGEIAAELAEAAGGFELLVNPLDRFDGILAQLSCYARRGVERPDVIFGYDTPPRNCSDAEWIDDGGELGNVVVGLGGGVTTNEFSDDDSIDQVGLLEVLAPHTDVSDRSLLDALAARELELRVEAKETVKMTPTPGLAPEPFTNFDIGDTVRAVAGPSLLGGFDMPVRISSFTITLEEAREKLTAIDLTRAP